MCIYVLTYDHSGYVCVCVCVCGGGGGGGYDTNDCMIRIESKYLSAWVAGIVFNHHIQMHVHNVFLQPDVHLARIFITHY